MLSRDPSLRPLRVTGLLPLLVGLLLTGCAAMPVSTTPGLSKAAFECPKVECPTCVALQCPEPQVIEKVLVKTLEVPVEVPVDARLETAGDLDLPIIGAVEWAMVDPPGIRLEARIDTGAETTSIHAEDIQLVEIDGKRFVRYRLVDPVSGASYSLESPLRRRVRIKQQEGVHERRLVVQMWLALGGSRLLVDVTLTSRADMDYPLLIGRNMLTDIAIVDVSRHHTLTN